MSSILSELSRLTGKEGDSICEVLENTDSLGGGGGYVTAGAIDGSTIKEYATAEGVPSKKEVGYGAHAEGETTQVLGAYSHGEGFGKVTSTSAECAHAEGYGTASAQGAHAEGRGTASAQNSHAEGNGTTTATARNAHAEGYGAASERNSHAEGNATSASGVNSHAEGNATTASGDNSHAEGNGTTASGANSHASGYSTIATADSQFVCGKYNERDDNAIFIVGLGNGTGSDPGTKRENIFSVGMYDGVKKFNFGDVSLTEDQLKKLLALITS